MSRLEISLLGPLRDHLDGRPVTRFRADSVRALLAYLALDAHTPRRWAMPQSPKLWPLGSSGAISKDGEAPVKGSDGSRLRSSQKVSRKER